MACFVWTKEDTWEVTAIQDGKQQCSRGIYQELQAGVHDTGFDKPWQILCSKGSCAAEALVAKRI